MLTIPLVTAYINGKQIEDGSLLVRDQIHMPGQLTPNLHTLLLNIYTNLVASVVTMYYLAIQNVLRSVLWYETS